jgi:type II secretory pathway pseudopilin PulG
MRENFPFSILLFRLALATKTASGKPNQRLGGLVLVEMLMVVMLIALMTSIAMFSFSAMSGKNYFKRKAATLVQTFQSAVNTAQQSDRRYAVILNFADKTWMLRQFNQLDFEGIPEDEAILKTGYFDPRFDIDYVLYDDGIDTREPRQGEITSAAIFFAGHGGWRNGGKVVLVDEDGQRWSIVIYRIGKPVELLPGDVSLLAPIPESEMPF